MTSRTDPFPTTYAAVPRFAWNRLAFWFTLTLAGIIVFSAAFAVGYARMNDGRVLPGVDVAGVELAGLTRNAAEAKLRTSLPSLSNGTLTVDLAGQQDSIAYSDIERDYDLDFMLTQAFGLGRGSNLIDQLREQMAILLSGISVAPQMVFNSDELSTRLAAMATSAEVAPVDATIARQNGHYIVTPSSAGTAVDLQQVVAAAMAAVDNLSPQSTQITVQGRPVVPAVTTEEAQAAADRAEGVVASDIGLAGADLSTLIDSDILRGWVYLNEVSLGEWQLSIAAEPIAQFLGTYALETDIAATNATFGFNGGDVTVIPSALGRALDLEATSATVLSALQARANGESPSSVSLALVPVEPEFTTAQAQALASRVTLLGTWTTNYIPQASNGFGVNIELPTAAIDGQVVQPGERFDYITAIGPVTSPPYVEGGVLIHGQVREDGAIGGGMCSSSTTLFNAVMRAGFQIDARGNHSIYISRYPVGLDATVYESGGQRRTMAFTNDTGYPVLIKGINDQGKVTFEVWGIDDGRTVELSDPVVENIVEGGNLLEYSDEVAPGVRKKKQDRYDAFESTVTRTVRDAQGSILHQNTFQSRYKKLDAITLVGRYLWDPPAGTQILPEQYPGAPRPDPTPDPDPTPPPTGEPTPKPSRTPKPTPTATAEPTPTPEPEPTPTPTEPPADPPPAG
ncbi:MAG: VanW family protein [Candidatus Limnocylindrales bacterium]